MCLVLGNVSYYGDLFSNKTCGWFEKNFYYSPGFFKGYLTGKFMKSSSGGSEYVAHAVWTSYIHYNWSSSSIEYSTYVSNFTSTTNMGANGTAYGTGCYINYAGLY